MKKTTAALIIAFVFLIGFSCKKNKPEAAYKSSATIIGFDLRLCVCCGGIKINIKDDANPNQDFKLISNSSDLGIKESDAFPISVEVDWYDDKANTCGNHIIVTRYKKL